MYDVPVHGENDDGGWHGDADHGVSWGHPVLKRPLGWDFVNFKRSHSCGLVVNLKVGNGRAFTEGILYSIAPSVPLGLDVVNLRLWKRWEMESVLRLKIWSRKWSKGSFQPQNGQWPLYFAPFPMFGPNSDSGNIFHLGLKFDHWGHWRPWPSKYKIQNCKNTDNNIMN